MNTAAEGAKEAPGGKPEVTPPQDGEVFAQALPVISKLRQLGLVEKDDSVERVVRQVAETKPALCFQHAGEFLQYPFAREILLACAQKAPKAVFTYADQYKLKDFAANVFEIAATCLAESDTETLFKSCGCFSHMPFAHDVLLKGAKFLGNKGGAVIPGSWYAFDCIELYADQPYAEEVLLTAVDNNGAWNAFNDAKKYIAKPFAEKVLLSAVAKNMWAAIKFKEGYLNAPFGKKVLLEVVGHLRAPAADEKKAEAPSGGLIMATKNGTPIRYGDLMSLVDCPFAEELFAELAQKSPDVFKGLWKEWRWQLLNNWKIRGWIKCVAELAGVEVDERKRA